MAVTARLMSLTNGPLPLQEPKRPLDVEIDQNPSKRARWSTSDDGSDEADQLSAQSDADRTTVVGSTSTPATPSSQSKNWRPFIYHCPRDDCDRVFNRPCRLAEHTRSHTNERPYKCDHPDCDKTFRRDTHLSRHIKSAHSNERNCPCSWPGCDKRFANATRMRRHYASHEQKERFRCTAYPPCNETFRKHKTLQSHIASVHLDQKPWPCTHVEQETGVQCTRGYNTEGKLRSHEAKAHSGELRFLCTLCTENNSDATEDSITRFATQAALKEHMQYDHAPRCDDCNIVFESQGKLASHIDQQHTALSSKTLFPCDEPGCGRSFAKRNNLKEHVRIVHRSEKRFVCGATDVSDSSKFEDEIDGHVTRVKWDGEGCGRAFGTRATLEEHVRTQHLGLEGSVRARKRRQLVAEGRDPELVKRLGSMAGGLTGKGSRSRKKAGRVEATSNQGWTTASAGMPVGKFYFGGLDEDDLAMDADEMDVDVGVDMTEQSLVDAMVRGGFTGSSANAYASTLEAAASVPVDPVLDFLSFDI